MSVTPPRLGSDPLLMSAYAVLPGAPHVSRVFLPLGHRGEAVTVTWAGIAREAGEDLSTASDLYDLLGEPAAREIHPYGEATPATVRTLLRALGRALPSDQEVIAADWPGYAATAAVETEVELSTSHLGPWPRSDFLVHRTTLDHLLRIAEREAPFPVYLWTPDHSLVLSCPIYSDSLFLSSESVTVADLREAGLEAATVLEDGPLAVTGS